MRSDVHFAALRAAAKVAFGMALLTGCTAAENANEILGGNADDGANDDSESTESAIAAKGGSKAKPGNGKKGSSVVGSKNSNCTKDAGPPKQTCEQVLASAFPDAGEGWPEGDFSNASKETKECCIAELKAKGYESPHRWTCCMATNWGQDANDQQVSIACTPWGPPVPPAMKRRNVMRPVRPEPDAWIAQGVA